MPSDSVLVTGGSGFIGSHVVEALMKEGYHVGIFDRREPSLDYHDSYFEGDIRDFDTLAAVVEKFDYIMHLAAVAGVDDVVRDPLDAESINVRGTVNVLEAARQKGARRVIYGSTTWVYSDVTGYHVDEGVLPAAPEHLYTSTKLASEHYCRSYQQLYGLPYTILRYGIPYGPRSRESTVISIFMKRALAGDAIMIEGSGEQFRQFIYVEDLARGHCACLQEAGENEIFNIDGAEKITIKDIAMEMQKLVPGTKVEYSDHRRCDFGGKEVSSKKAHGLLSWTPRVSFADGMKRTMEWHLNQADNPMSAEVPGEEA